MSARAATATAVRAVPARVWHALAFATAVGAAVMIIAAQPVRGPWWVYAEADAVYVGNALNLLGGIQVRYLDHPGLPLEELAAVAFGAEFVVEVLTGDVGSRMEYVDGRMLDLDQATPIFRGLAIMIYLGGTVAFFLLFSRLFGHWVWGLSAALLWLGAPGLIATSIQYKADVSLAVLIGVFAYLIGRAVEQRSAALYAWAAFVAGFAVMVKLHALGLVVPLLLAVAWRPPSPGWWGQLRDQTTAWAKKEFDWPRFFAFVGVLAVLAVAVLLNVGLTPFTLESSEKLALAYPPIIVAVLLALGWLVSRMRLPVIIRVLSPFTAFIVAAYFIGLTVPALFDFPDWARALHLIQQAVIGRGVNTGVEPFGLDVFAADNAELRRGLVVFVIAAAAAIVGLVRRDPRPVIWFAGASALVAMAFARQAYVHYFAPGFILTIPAALWLVSRAPRRAGLVLVWVLVALVAIPVFQDRNWPTEAFEQQVATVSPSVRAIEERLKPGEVALTAYYWPEPDNRWFNDVQSYVNYAPEYPYKFLPAFAVAAQLAAERDLVFRYYTGPEVASLEGTQTVALRDVGTFKMRRLEDYEFAAELLSGPGVAKR